MRALYNYIVYLQFSQFAHFAFSPPSSVTFAIVSHLYVTFTHLQLRRWMRMDMKRVFTRAHILFNCARFRIWFCDVDYSEIAHDCWRFVRLVWLLTCNIHVCAILHRFHVEFIALHSIQFNFYQKFNECCHCSHDIRAYDSYARLRSICFLCDWLEMPAGVFYVPWRWMIKVVWLLSIKFKSL